MGKIFPAIMIILFVMELGIFCSARNSSLGCIEQERNALLRFKASLEQSSNRLSSWNVKNEDCCAWEGVKCNRSSGHIIAIDLSYKMLDDYMTDKINGYSRIEIEAIYSNQLKGKMLDSSLFELKYLTYLDLSWNDFQGSKIPSFLGSMKHLNHLNLSYSNFAGLVPHHLGNLSSLRVLDLSCGFFNAIDGRIWHNRFQDLIVDDVRWAINLSSLEYLDMSYVDLSSTKDTFKVLNMLPFLSILRLKGSELSNTHLLHACVNSTMLAKLKHLDLSANSLVGGFPCFIQNTTLSYLDLSHNTFKSSGSFDLLGLKNLTHLNLGYNFFAHEVEWISRFMWNLCNLKSLILSGNEFDWDVSGLFRNISGCWSRNLERLSLSYNNLYGHLPATLGSFRSLRVLEIAGNHLSGRIPISLGQLSNLESINISFNSFEGTFSEAHFMKLSNLELLMLESTMMIFEVPYDWMPPFQLKVLIMGSSKIVGQFPKWLQNQKALLHLYLSNCGIEALPKWLNLMNLMSLDLSHNNITGPIPELASTLTFLDLSNNMITHDLPNNIGHMMPLLEDLVLAKNLINGTLPDSFCELKNLENLDLSNNHLSGYLPDCWHKFRDLYVARLSFNELSGVIPNSIGGALSLGWLHLNNNKFIGQLPSTLKNSTKLVLFHVGGNSLSGKLLDWFGEGMPDLRVLILRNNEFNGTIPSSFCQLLQLQVMNLADNNLTGNIPHCFGNLSGMKATQWRMYLHEWEEESFTQVVNGVEQEYTKNSRFLVNLDLSSNYLFGEIPSDLTALHGLVGLNLSHNNLRGEIPTEIGDLESLFSLDLSSNSLYGRIPDSLSNLNFLSHLNFSNNNLSGKIPAGNQLQTLDDPSIYEGNPQLCGFPLPKKCHNDEAPSTEKHEAESEDTIDKALFYGFIVAGFATGFWGFIGVLVVKIKWRQVYFRFIEVEAEKMVGY